MNFAENVKTQTESREKNKTGFAEFTPDEFVGVLQSPKFIDALLTASQITKKTGYETDFHVNVLGDKKIYIPEVNQGLTDRMTGSKTIKEMDGEIFFDEGNYEKGKGCLINLHFHPDNDEAIRPSEQDMSHQLLGEGESFMCVARVDKIGNVEILLVYPRRIILREDLEDYEENLPSPYADQQDVNEYLNEFGFNTFTVSYENSKKSLKLDNLSKDTISNLKNIKVRIEKS